MTIKIDVTEIKVPNFISSCLPKHEKEFDVFLKEVLAAQTAKIRKKESAFNSFMNGMFNGKK